MSTQQEEVLRSMADQLLGQINREIEAVKVNVAKFSKSNITKLSSHQFYAELNKDLDVIQVKSQEYNNIMKTKA